MIHIAPSFSSLLGRAISCILGPSRSDKICFGDTASHSASLAARDLYRRAILARQNADAFQRNLHNPVFIDRLALALKHESRLSLKLARRFMESERYYGILPDGARVKLCDVLEDSNGHRLQDMFLRSATILAELDREFSEQQGSEATVFVDDAIVDSGNIRTPLHELRQKRIQLEAVFERDHKTKN